MLPDFSTFTDWFALALSAGLAIGTFAAFASDRKR